MNWGTIDEVYAWNGTSSFLAAGNVYLLGLDFCYTFETTWDDDWQEIETEYTYVAVSIKMCIYRVLVTRSSLDYEEKGRGRVCRDGSGST